MRVSYYTCDICHDKIDDLDDDLEFEYTIDGVERIFEVSVTCKTPVAKGSDAMQVCRLDICPKCLIKILGNH